MAELIQEYATPIIDESGKTYLARAYGQERSDGTWEGWLEFYSEDGEGKVLRTGQETSQPNRKAIEYWSSGLEAIYLEGAFSRASASVIQ